MTFPRPRVIPEAAPTESLTAPSKRLVWFEESGHEPFVDEPTKFNALTAELVRPALPSESSDPLVDA
jgi:pimeloyl-ACP methyl ester carboxylesterase